MMDKKLRSFTIGNLEIWENGEVFKIKDGTKTKLEEIGDKRGFTHEYIRQVLVSIESGGVNKQRVKSSKKAKERIEWLEERIKKYQIEKDFLEEKVLKEVEN